MNATQLLTWVRRVWDWLLEFRVAWIGLLVCAAAISFSLRGSASEAEIRGAGWLLQILGMATVAEGVRKTRQLFGRPSMWSEFRRWVARFPSLRRNVIVGAGTGIIAGAGARARGFVWTPMDESAPVEKQLNAFHQNILRLKDRISALEQTVDSVADQATEQVKKERDARVQSVQQLHERLESAETGGLSIALVGLLWLIVGVTLTTLSPELRSWRS